MDSIVRVAVVDGDRIVDDRLASKGDVRVAGRVLRLVEQRRGVAFLNVPDGAVGVLAQEGRGPAPIAAGTVALASDARGWLELQGRRVLIQVLPRPAAPPRAALPAGVRVGVAGSFDGRFAIALGVVLALEIAGIVAVRRAPDRLPFEAEVESLDRFRPVTLAPPAPKAAPAAAPSRRPATPAAPPSAHPAPAPSPRVDRDAIRRLGILTVLGALDRTGAAGRVFGEDAGRPAIADAFRNVREVGPSDRPSARRAAHGPEVDPQAIGGLEHAFSPAGARPELAGRAPLGPGVVIGGPEDQFPGEPPAPGDDAAIVARELKRRVHAVQACYEEALRLHGALRGRIELQLVIATTGRVQAASIEANTLERAGDQVAACVANRARTWTFGVRPPEPLTLAFPFVLSPGS